MEHYFKRINDLTPTRFWINNVTEQEAHMAIEEGAIGCTQNPSYSYKMITNENAKEHCDKLIAEYIANGLDNDDVLVHLQRELVGEIAKIFLPMYESTKGKHGYVSIQGNPFKEDCNTIVQNALFNREVGPNIMAKVPVTEEGLKAIEILVGKGVPINATEVMAVRQALDVCEIYKKVSSKMENPAPIYFSHITGIYDEYLKQQVERENIDISSDILWQAGMIIAKKTYAMAKTTCKEVGFIGGGARGLHHFTEMVGADANITINWKGTADKLIEENPVVIDRFNTPVAEYVLDELCSKLKDFSRGYFVDGITPEEYENFGPVVHFRNSFEKAWKSAIDYIQEKR